MPKKVNTKRGEQDRNNEMESFVPKQTNPANRRDQDHRNEGENGVRGRSTPKKRMIRIRVNNYIYIERVLYLPDPK